MKCEKCGTKVRTQGFLGGSLVCASCAEEIKEEYGQ